MRKRDLIQENNLLRKENELLLKSVNEIRWDQDKLKFRLEKLLSKWEKEDQEN